MRITEIKSIRKMKKAAIKIDNFLSITFPHKFNKIILLLIYNISLCYA